VFANSVGKQKSIVVCSKSWPTFYVGQQCLPFTNLFVFCWPTSGKLRCDWLAVVNIMTPNGRMHLALTTLIILFHFTSTLSTTAPNQISGAYVFAYEQLNKSLLQQHSRNLMSLPFPPYCCPTKCCRVRHKCWPTIQHLLVVSAASRTIHFCS